PSCVTAIPLPPPPPLFPYTTLFRSLSGRERISQLPPPELERWYTAAAFFHSAGAPLAQMACGSGRTRMCPSQLSRRCPPPQSKRDRKSTRLNSSHVSISYAVFCLKK